MDYYEDALEQLQKVLQEHGNEEIKNIYKKEIQQIFFQIYILNYFSNRIELKHFFKSNYYEIAFSCLLESFSLILNNYPRGSSLVLRSSLENFTKHIISIECNDKYKVNDKSYAANKKNYRFYY